MNETRDNANKPPADWVPFWISMTVLLLVTIALAAVAGFIQGTHDDNGRVISVVGFGASVIGAFVAIVFLARKARKGQLRKMSTIEAFEASLTCFAYPIAGIALMISFT